MKLFALTISNYKSFSRTSQTINFGQNKIAIIGKNNSGKSNIIKCIEMLIGSKDPRYIQTEESDYFNPDEPLEIKLSIVSEKMDEIYQIAIPQKHKDIFYSKFKKNGVSPHIEISFTDALTEEKKPTEKFSIEVAGVAIHQKIPEARASICKLIVASPLRSTKEDLKCSQWTIYGNLMKSLLEDSGRYDELNIKLHEINELIVEILEREKSKILESAKIFTFIDDIRFQLTKENKPSELLRNLEIFIKDKNKYFHVDDTGTGTQSALIISILELALTYKSSHSKTFIIEEPELFIHPQGIRYLSTLFNDYINENDSQVIATTHSAILISTYKPTELVRLDKSTGESRVYQLPYNFVDSNHKIERSLGENSEMFFADHVILVEGETEKIIFPEISKKLKFDDGTSKNFLKHNISTINVNGKDNVFGYIKILDTFQIKWHAIVDDDFLSRKSSYCPLCKYFNITPRDAEYNRVELFKKNISVLKAGETEDYIPDIDLSEMTGIDISGIKSIKAAYSKTSKAFEDEIFRKTKPEIAYDIIDFYSTKETTPFDVIINWIYE